VLERDLMFVINLVLLSIKLLLITLEFFYKNHILGATPTVLDDNGEQKIRHKRNNGDIELGVVARSSVFVGVNPLHEDSIPPAEDVEEESKESQPLLQRMKKVESIIEEEGRAVRAKVECVETKVESVETKMGEDTRLLRSHMSNLEQDNSTLREENKAFKSRLDTLERKLS
jgi:hypothetical protein